MLKRRGGLDLHHEPLGTEDRGEFRAQNLERDVSVVLEVMRQVHGRHAAGAELALDFVAAGQRGVEAVELRGHFFSASAVRSRNSYFQSRTTTVSCAVLRGQRVKLLQPA